MTWNIRLAIWLCNLLCPRIGATKPPPNCCPDKIEVNEDILWNRDLEPDELGDDDIAEWAEYCTRHPSTIHHLNRCLHK